MADSEPFQSFWFGDGLLPHQWLCMTSFIDYGHAYRLYSYEPITVPRGVECRDAREILPRERVFFYPRGAGAGSVAGFANLFRYKLLAEHGGWWVDTDVVCRKSIVSDAELVFAREQPYHICNAVLKLPRGHPLAWHLFTEADRAGADLDWGETGPDLLTRAIEGSIYDRHVLPSAFCYPILGADAMQFLDPEQGAAVERKTSGSPLIHLWNEMWRRTGVDCFAAPPAGSFMAKLFEAHRLDFDETVKRILLDCPSAETTHLRAQLRHVVRESAARQANADCLQNAVAKLRAETATQSLRNNEMARSTSWRITAPLRAVGRRLPSVARLYRTLIRSFGRFRMKILGLSSEDKRTE